VRKFSDGQQAVININGSKILCTLTNHSVPSHCPSDSVSDFKNKSVQESEKVCKVGKQHFLPKNILKTINVVVSMCLVSHSCFFRSEYTKKKLITIIVDNDK
jgi:hypothetical protein